MLNFDFFKLLFAQYISLYHLIFPYFCASCGSYKHHMGSFQTCSWWGCNSYVSLPGGSDFSVMFPLAWTNYEWYMHHCAMGPTGQFHRVIWVSPITRVPPVAQASREYVKKPNLIIFILYFPPIISYYVLFSSPFLDLGKKGLLSRS